MNAVAVNRFDVYQVNLDPTIGSEISKSRPCVVISPDEMNKHVNTVIIAPLTRTVRNWPSRVQSAYGGTRGEIALDQMRAVDKRRLVKHLGVIDPVTQTVILTTLAQIFSL